MGKIEEEDLLTKNELAKVLKVSPRTIEAWTQAEVIPYHRFGDHTVRYNLEEVLATARNKKARRKKARP